MRVFEAPLTSAYDGFRASPITAKARTVLEKKGLLSSYSEHLSQPVSWIPSSGKYTPPTPVKSDIYVCSLNPFSFKGFDNVNKYDKCKHVFLKPFMFQSALKSQTPMQFHSIEICRPKKRLKSNGYQVHRFLLTKVPTRVEVLALRFTR